MKEDQFQETHGCRSVKLIQLIARQLKRTLPEFPTGFPQGIRGATQYGRESIDAEATLDLIPRKTMQNESTMLRGEQSIDHAQEKHNAASQKCSVAPPNHHDTVVKDLRKDHTVTTRKVIHRSSRGRPRVVEIGRKVIETENHRDTAASLTITSAAVIHRIITLQGIGAIKKDIRRYIQAMVQGMIGNQLTEPGRRDEFHQQAPRRLRIQSSKTNHRKLLFPLFPQLTMTVSRSVQNWLQQLDPSRSAGKVFTWIIVLS